MSRIKNILIVSLFGLTTGASFVAAQEAAVGHVSPVATAASPPKAKLEMADPLAQEQVLVDKAGGNLLSGVDPDNASAVDCKMNRSAKGSVVARKGSKSLVVFNQGDWSASCKKAKGLNDMPMVWIDNDKLKTTKSLSLDNYGDRCAAYEFLEKQIPLLETAVEGTGAPCSGADCNISPMDEVAKKASPMADAAKQFVEMSAFHSGNRCYIENDRDKRGPECSFSAMLNDALSCKDAKGKEVRCSQGECEKRLGRDACKSSPWKDTPVDERFQLIMKYAKEYAPEYGVEARAIPCIATVETGYLEPQAKTLLACGNTRMNRYHGLGMITQQTLEHYVSPFTKFKVKTGPKGTIKEIKSFRSKNPLLQRPSLYACPEKLHDALGSSPDLQVELMAYTLAEKLAATNGNEYQSYVNYNGLGTPDSENGRPHMNNYADAVQACVRCLRERLPEKPPNKPKLGKNGKPIPLGDPVECLSAATRGATNHPFFMQPGRRIYDVFDGHKKRYCEEGGK